MSLKLNSSGGGSVTLSEPVTASNLTLSLPAVTATVLTDSAGVLNIGSGQVYKDASGNVGIGTSSPTAKFEVTGSGYLARFTGSGGQFQGFGVRNNFGSASQAADNFYDVINESGAVVANMLGSIQTDGGSSWTWATQAPGTRTDRRADRIRIPANGGLLAISDGGGLGYGAGSGGTVTQATSKSTAVTLNKPTGQITMNAAALAAGASVTFQVNNSLVGGADVPCVAVSSLTGSYRAEVAYSVNGSFFIRVTNVSGGSLSDALQINFTIIKGSNA